MILPISKVEPRRISLEIILTPKALQELSDSIAQYGLIQPITVRKLDNGYYQIIAGERRWRASRMAGLTEVPVRVLEADDRRTAELALVENLQREDLNPIEEAKGYQTLMHDFGLTQEETAKSVGRSRPAVANSLRLLSLTPPVMELVEKGELSAGHARALIPIENETRQLNAAQEVIRKNPFPSVKPNEWPPDSAAPRRKSRRRRTTAQRGLCGGARRRARQKAGTEGAAGGRQAQRPHRAGILRRGRPGKAH